MAPPFGAFGGGDRRAFGARFNHLFDTSVNFTSAQWYRANQGRICRHVRWSVRAQLTEDTPSSARNGGGQAAFGDGGQGAGRSNGFGGFRAGIRR